MQQESKLQIIFVLKNLHMEHISLKGLDPKQFQDNVFSGCLTLTSPDSDPDCQSLSYLQISASMKCIPFDPGSSSAKCDETFRWQNVGATFVLLLSLFAATDVFAVRFSVPNRVCLSPLSRLFALLPSRMNFPVVTTPAQGPRKRAKGGQGQSGREASTHGNVSSSNPRACSYKTSSLLLSDQTCFFGQASL